MTILLVCPLSCCLRSRLHSTHLTRVVDLLCCILMARGVHTLILGVKFDSLFSAYMLPRVRKHLTGSHNYQLEKIEKPLTPVVKGDLAAKAVDQIFVRICQWMGITAVVGACCIGPPKWCWFAYGRKAIVWKKPLLTCIGALLCSTKLCRRWYINEFLTILNKQAKKRSWGQWK